MTEYLIMNWSFILALWAKLCINHFTPPHPDGKKTSNENLILHNNVEGKQFSVTTTITSTPWPHIPSFNFSKVVCSSEQASPVNSLFLIHCWDHSSITFGALLTNWKVTSWLIFHSNSQQSHEVGRVWMTSPTLRISNWN